jgi:hypothetical protein
MMQAKKKTKNIMKRERQTPIIIIVPKFATTFRNK